MIIVNRKAGKRRPTTEVDRRAEQHGRAIDAEIARLAKRGEKEGVAGFGDLVVELHSSDALGEDHHLARIGRQHIVELLVTQTPDVKRVEVGREIGRRRYEFE
ncbi:hypothetical protein A8B77_05905 [Erythrobacter sp. EhN03]|uniref:hypothetical protein n=1 Tax=Qipengyuania flava TaxID=192812 RepID=UPI0007F50FCA|nr:hypothetical protein A8B77_05905 [Erythrobacter sp. EhN03]